MALDPERLAQIVSDLTNALQTAVLLTNRLEPDLHATTRHAIELRVAVERAALAAGQLRELGDTR